MLEIRPLYQNWGKALPYSSEDAMICTFECTFCKTYVENVLKHICPNCGGDFEKRLIRPKSLLKKYRASNTHVFNFVENFDSEHAY